MKRFLMIGAVLVTAMLCVSSEVPACERLSRRVGAVATAPLRLLKTIHQRRHHSSTAEMVQIEISVTE